MYLLPVKLFRGKYPPKGLLKKYQLDTLATVVGAVSLGNLKLFNQIMEEHEVGRDCVVLMACHIEHAPLTIGEEVLVCRCSQPFTLTYCTGVAIHYDPTPLPAVTHSLCSGGVHSPWHFADLGETEGSGLPQSAVHHVG
jgi:hypothetical protein